MKDAEDEAFDDLAKKQGHWGGGYQAKRAMAANKQEAAQEPVAWVVQGCAKMWRGEFAEIDAQAEAKRIGGTCVAYALYTTPQQRPWVGLTDEEMQDLWDRYAHMEMMRAIEAKLKEKNS